MTHPNIAAQLYGVPHGILSVFNTILYEHEFENPQLFHLHERSTLDANAGKNTQNIEVVA
jgi:hypothetical protein